MLELDKRNDISYSIGFISNILILTLLLGFFLSFLIISIFLLVAFINKFILMIVSSNIYMKFIILFFLLILLKLRQKQDLAKDIDMKLKKYFNRQDTEGLIKYKAIIMMFCVYISLCLLGLMLYKFTGNQISNSNKSDIINIFIWATYLLAPIVAIWVFSDWRIQKKYEVNKEVSLNLLTVILELENCLEELMAITTEFRCLKNDDELNFFGKKCDELSLRFIDLINKLKSNNNMHHGLVRDFKGNKIISLEMLNSADSFFQSLIDMVFEIHDNYDSDIKLKSIVDQLLQDTIKAVGENQISYRDYFGPIKELLSSECQPYRKASFKLD
ncbi:hypothetical protein [Acinetobacter populi]|uniref:hypothetical protein n=1 Tax=Acinetobacter populi TaxID=1582270 RepID=UPI00148C7A2C|nr:hypothetical protein [Acinetobacter populi]